MFRSPATVIIGAIGAWASLENLRHPAPQHGYTIRKKDRNWAVIDPQGQLVCLTVYKRGAVEVVRRLAA